LVRAEEIALDRLAEVPQGQDDSGATSAEELDKPVSYPREWRGDHRVNLRATLPLPFGKWYVTLVAGPERRRKERRVEELKKHPLETTGNLMFLLSIGIVSTALLLTAVALVLIHGFGWSIEVTIPST
jgi:hypothetical protein